MHLGFRWGEYHTGFTLLYENRVYENLYNKGSPLPGCNQLFFDIPVATPFSAGDVITVSLFNLKQKRAYKNVQSCVSVPDPDPLPLAVCSYISDYNTIPELRSWIAFQRVVNVSKIMFFQATPIPGFTEAFGHLIREGYVEVVDYTWPRLQIGMKLQRNNQQSQVNACFYRLKYRASAVVLCDVDEYVHSEKYPFDLPEVVRYTRRTHPEYDLVTMGANRYTNEKNNLTQRETMLEEGKLFDAYQYRLSTHASGAFKMIAFSDFNGMLSIHVCFFCTAWKNIPLEYARVAHFKVRVSNGTYQHSTTLSSYSPFLREEIAALKKNELL